MPICVISTTILPRSQHRSSVNRVLQGDAQVEDPVRCGTHRGTLLSHRQAVDLRGVPDVECQYEPVSHERRCGSVFLQPRYTLETDPKEDVVEEEECYTGGGHLTRMRIARLFAVPDQDCDDEVAKALTSCSVHEHLPAAPAFDVRYADHGEEQIGHAVDRGDQSRHAVAHADGFNQDGGQVV